MSIGGGGRYDKIITTFMNDGTEYPAVGMSFGLDVIYEILMLKKPEQEISIVDLFVIPMDTQVESFRFCSKMREIGVKTEMEKKKQKMKRSLGYANKCNIPFVIIIGENEILTHRINLKNMRTGVENEFDIDDLEGIKKAITVQ